MSWIVPLIPVGFPAVWTNPKEGFGAVSRGSPVGFFVWLLACDLRYLHVPRFFLF